MELKYNAEETANHSFLQAWKTDDPEWVKARKKEWLSIKGKFNYFPEGFQKKNLKFIRSYFLTGLVEADWASDEVAIALRTHNQPLSIVRYIGSSPEGLLISFWLSPDHSQENWERIKCVYCYDLWEREGKEAPINYSDYHGACLFFRDMTRFYQVIETSYEKKRWYAEFTDHKDCGSIFGETLDQFFLKELKIERADNGRLHYGTIANFRFSNLASILNRFLSGLDFNPNNPIKYFIKDYVQFGLPETRLNEHSWGNESKLVTFCWHVVETPEGRHPTQLVVARELKEEILKVKNFLPEDAQKMIDQGISIFESGKIKEYFLKCQGKGVEKEPRYKFIKENLGIDFW